MRTPSGRFVALAFSLLFFASALAPLATADHAYSHRYLIYGRVIDEAGNPMRGVTVRAGLDNKLTVEGACGNQPNTETDAWGRTETRPTTNEAGEFFFCFHMHSIARGTTADAHVNVSGVEMKQPVNENFRKSFFVVKVPGTNGTDDSPLFSQYLVSGRLWYAEPAKLVDGINVHGDTVHEQTVKITFAGASGVTVTEETQSNHYGDFGVRLNVSSEETGGTITIESGGDVQTFTADMASRWTDVNFRTDAESTSRTLLIAAGVVLASAVLIAGGWYAWKRMAESREDAAARARSTRKRAQR